MCVRVQEERVPMCGCGCGCAYELRHACGRRAADRAGWATAVEVRDLQRLWERNGAPCSEKCNTLVTSCHHQQAHARAQRARVAAADGVAVPGHRFLAYRAVYISASDRFPRWSPDRSRFPVPLLSSAQSKSRAKLRRTAVAVEGAVWLGPGQQGDDGPHHAFQRPGRRPGRLQDVQANLARLAAAGSAARPSQEATGLRQAAHTLKCTFG